MTLLRPAATLAILLLVLSAASGCGPSCQDACSASMNCRARIDGAPAPTESEINACADACDRDQVCANQDAAIECLSTLQCEDLAAAAERLEACDRLCCEGPNCPVQ